MAESSLRLPKQSESRRKTMDRPPVALSAELQCSICLDDFTDPVTTPCGHNFCKNCLNQCWNNSQTYSCPYCKEPFSKRPDLKINTALREVVEQIKGKSGQSQSEVLCDICDDVKMKALKMCLVCQSSYCETHLKPHQRDAKLKKHKLIDPEENLDKYICEKHEKPLELFCRDDQTCLCLLCAVTDHRNHNTVALEEESRERKGQLKKMQTDVQQMIKDRMKKIQDINHSAQLKKESSEREKAESLELFTDLIRSIERRQSELLEMMEQRQKAAEKQTEELMKDLEQEIIELKRRDTELEQLSHTEDHLRLLQIYPSLNRPSHTSSLTHASMSDPQLSVETLRKTLDQLQKTLCEKLSTAVDVTLDPDTAHPCLILSDNGKQVTYGDVDIKLPENSKRFDTCCCVLSKEGFSSGRFYFEVQVKGKTDWDLGVARESVNRKGEIIANSGTGYWAVGLSNKNQYEAAASSLIPLSLSVKPQVVGVFVDYEEGLVSFYDAKSGSHIYSYSGQSFTEKLFPFFSPSTKDEGRNSAPLIISQITK